VPNKIAIFLVSLPEFILKQAQILENRVRIGIEPRQAYVLPEKA
jgi:hypothetical protein